MSHFPTIVVLVCYTLIVYSVAFLAQKRTRAVSDYVLGSRNLSGFVTALSAGASDMSSWLLMALPGAVFSKGVGVIWLPVSLTLGAYINWRVVALRLRVYSEVLDDALTLPAYISRRFGEQKRSLRLVTGVVIMLFFCLYAVAGFVSAAKLAQLTFGWPYRYALWGSGLFIVAYTTLGGFLAVSWVDVFQGLLMFFALLLVPCMAYSKVDNFAQGVQWLGKRHSGYWHIFEGMTLGGVVSMMAWGLGYVGQPHIIGRFMAIRSIKELPVARRICTGWMLIAMLGACGVGVTGAVYYRMTALQDSELVFLRLSAACFNRWMSGVLLCAVLSSIMSTVSCLILLSASALVEDFFGVLFPARQEHTSDRRVGWHRVAVVGVALVSLLIASTPGLTIMQSVALPWCGLGASLGPVVVGSLYWRRMTHQGAMAGIFSGGGFVVVWELLRRAGNSYVNAPYLLPGFCILPAFLLSSVMIVIVSLCTKMPSEAVRKEFESASTLW